jgi:hypothetical protein
MSKKMASLLIGYGLVLAGLSLVVQNIAPAFGRIAFFAGLAGGGFSLLWGVAALAGLRGRVWAMLTAMATAFVLLTQAVHVWMASSGEGAGSLTVCLLVTSMFLLTVGMLMYLLHGERPPEFYQGRKAADVRKTP